jgi:hypothetical protein
MNHHVIEILDAKDDIFWRACHCTAEHQVRALEMLQALMPAAWSVGAARDECQRDACQCGLCRDVIGTRAAIRIVS